MSGKSLHPAQRRYFDPIGLRGFERMLIVQRYGSVQNWVDRVMRYERNLTNGLANPGPPVIGKCMCGVSLTEDNTTLIGFDKDNQAIVQCRARNCRQKSIVDAFKL